MGGMPLEKNPNWKGGRTVTSHGYVKIKVPEHPYADVSGYVYEHRLVMEKIIGRYLKPQEIVHHLNENRSDNSPGNLALATSVAEHKVHHRIHQDRRKPGEPNPLIPCACGCGEYLLKYDDHNRPRKYLGGHGKKGKLSYDPDETIECACGCGRVLTRFDHYARERRFVSGHNTRLLNPNSNHQPEINQITERRDAL